MYSNVTKGDIKVVYDITIKANLKSVEKRKIKWQRCFSYLIWEEEEY